MIRKYIVPVIFLIIMKGSSIGLAPAHVRIQNEVASIIFAVFSLGLNFDLLFLLFFVEITGRIRILATNANTPPSLFGIERRIAYAKRKYHSG